MGEMLSLQIKWRAVELKEEFQLAVRQEICLKILESMNLKKKKRCIVNQLNRLSRHIMFPIKNKMHKVTISKVLFLSMKRKKASIKILKKQKEKIF